MPSSRVKRAIVRERSLGGAFFGMGVSAKRRFWGVKEDNIAVETVFLRLYGGVMSSGSL